MGGSQSVLCSTGGYCLFEFIPNNPADERVERMATTRIIIEDTPDGVTVQLECTEDMSLCDAASWTDGQRIGAQIYIDMGVTRAALEGTTPKGQA